MSRYWGLFDWRVVLQNACPTCHAEAGQPCVHRGGGKTRKGDVRNKPHKKRVELSQRSQRAA